MIYPEIRRIHSPDLEPPNLPQNPSDCEIVFQMVIGPKDADGEESFNFTVITPAHFARNPEARWGRGKLIVPVFDWSVLAQAVAKLLAQCSRPSWGEVVAELNKELFWQFDGYKSEDA